MPPNLARDLAVLFPACVAICIATPTMFDGPLFAEEAAGIANANAKRRAEFAAGRSAARIALAELGAAPRPLPIARGKEPSWPDGFVASITHCEGFCAAAAARTQDALGIGFDAENAGPLGEELDGLILRPSEAAHIASLPAIIDLDWRKVAFSAKEAFYKYDQVATGRDLEFLDLDVCLSLGPTSLHGGFAISVATAARRQPGAVDIASGTWRADRRHVYAAVTRLRDGRFFCCD